MKCYLRLCYFSSDCSFEALLDALRNGLSRSCIGNVKTGSLRFTKTRSKAEKKRKQIYRLRCFHKRFGAAPPCPILSN